MQFSSSQFCAKYSLNHFIALLTPPYLFLASLEELPCVSLTASGSFPYSPTFLRVLPSCHLYIIIQVLEKSLLLLFEHKDVSLVKQYVQRQLLKVLQGRVSLQDLTFAKEYRGARGYKPGACVPALHLARLGFTSSFVVFCGVCSVSSFVCLQFSSNISIFTHIDR